MPPINCKCVFPVCCVLRSVGDSFLLYWSSRVRVSASNTPPTFCWRSCTALPRPWSWDPSRCRPHDICGLLLPLYTAAISGQISRIPGVSKTIIYTQLIGGTLSTLFLTIPACFFATTAYRLDRPPGMTMLLDDLSWILVAMPFPSLLAQNLTFSHAILLGRRPTPLFPP